MPEALRRKLSPQRAHVKRAPGRGDQHVPKLGWRLASPLARDSRGLGIARPIEGEAVARVGVQSPAKLGELDAEGVKPRRLLDGVPVTALLDVGRPAAAEPARPSLDYDGLGQPV